MWSVGSHPHFIPIIAAQVCSSQEVKANFKWISVALPVLIPACLILILTATFAHDIHSILWENVTVCILDGLKTLTPRTQGNVSAWEALRVIGRPYTTNVSCYSEDWCIVTFKHLNSWLAGSQGFVSQSWIGESGCLLMASCIHCNPCHLFPFVSDPAWCCWQDLWTGWHSGLYFLSQNRGPHFLGMNPEKCCH